MAESFIVGVFVGIIIGTFYGVRKGIEITKRDAIELTKCVEINDEKTYTQAMEDAGKSHIFWHKDNPEDGMESAEELVSQFIDEDSVGQIIELEVAIRLPNIKVKILPDNSDGSVNLEYL